MNFLALENQKVRIFVRATAPNATPLIEIPTTLHSCFLFVNNLLLVIFDHLLCLQFFDNESFMEGNVGALSMFRQDCDTWWV